MDSQFKRITESASEQSVPRHVTLQSYRHGRSLANELSPLRGLLSLLRGV